MDSLLAIVRVRGKKDLVTARQQTRRLAHLLGFEAREQACLAAAVFALACQAYRRRKSVRIYFQVKRKSLRISFGPKKRGVLSETPRLEKVLPASAAFENADLKWIVKELARHHFVSLFEELEQANRELLQAMLDTEDAGASKRREATVSREKSA
jgi:hypothetical protein